MRVKSRDPEMDPSRPMSPPCTVGAEPLCGVGTDATSLCSKSMSRSTGVIVKSCNQQVAFSRPCAYRLCNQEVAYDEHQ
jgi:hypothetical protein